MLRKLALAALVRIASPATQAGAQGSWPDRPIKFIVHVAAGGGVDLNARILADRLSKQLPQPILIENQGGGGGAIAARARRQGRSRRLHVPVCRPGPRRGAVHAQGAALRPDQGFRAGHAGDEIPAGDGDQPEHPGEEPRRVHRAAEARARQAHLRLERRRRLLAHPGRDVRPPRRRADDPRAVPRQRPLLRGAARRPDRHDRRRPRAAGRQHRREPRPRARRHHQGAHAVPARRAGGVGDLAGLPVPDVGRRCSRRPRRRRPSSTAWPPRCTRRCRTR